MKKAVWSIRFHLKEKNFKMFQKVSWIYSCWVCALRLNCMIVHFNAVRPQSLVRNPIIFLNCHPTTRGQKKKQNKKKTTDLRSVSQQKYSRFLLMAPTCVIWGKTKTNKYSNTVNGNSWLRVKNRMRQEGLTPACTLRMGHSTQLHFSGAFV